MDYILVLNVVVVGVNVSLKRLFFKFKMENIFILGERRSKFEYITLER